MLIGLTQSQVQDWNKSLHSYQKQKRTKRPFGPAQPKIQHKSVNEIIQKQMRFNPVLQSFRSEREQQKTIQNQQIQKMNQQIKYLKNNYKYNTDYDIINFNQSIALPPTYRSHSFAHQDQRKKQHKDPIYQNYNIINGKIYQNQYLRQVGYRNLKGHDRNIHPEESRVYNIINGKYSDHLQELASMEESRNNQQILNKSQQLRVYDTINSKYYNPQLEESCQRKMKQQQMIQSQRKQQKLPPSYVNRQPYIQGKSKEIPEIVKKIDQRNNMAKQRYKLRYIVDNQYRMRNDYQSEKKQQQIKNKVHNGRILEQKGKQFNIINSQRYENSRAEELFGKQITGSPYDLRSIQQSPIKQNGFSNYSTISRE